MKKSIYHRSMYCALIFACIMFSSCSGKEDQMFPEQLIQVEFDQGNGKSTENQSEGYLLGDVIHASGDEIERNLNNILYGSKDGISEKFLQNFYHFIEETSVYVFRDKPSENLLYAPFNWYLTLSMLGDMTEGEAKEEILEALGISDSELNAAEVNSASHALERKHTHAEKLKLRNSLWLDDNIKYQEDKISHLQDQYRNEVYQGDLKNSEFLNQMSEWVYKNTGFALKPNYNNLFHNGDPCAFVSLNSLEFFNEWIFPFNEEDTTTESFTLSDNQIITCDFMKMEKEFYPFLVGEDYVSTACTLKENETMVFILLEEGISVEEFMGREGKLLSIMNDWIEDHYTTGKVRFSLPKFAYEKEINLKEVAESMGVKKVFDLNSNAFSSFADEELTVGEITQTSKIEVNEKGCSVSTYTEMKAFGSGGSKDEVEINFNRPFIYVLYKDKIPFMVGIVQNPLG